MDNKKGTTNSKTVPSQHAGGATSMDTIKKTAANKSRQMLRAKASMGPKQAKTESRTSWRR